MSMSVELALLFIRPLHQGDWQVCGCLQRNSRIALRTLISHHCLLSLLIPLTSSVSSCTITAIAPYQIRRHNQRHYPQVTTSWCRHSPILQPLLGSHHHRVDYILVPVLTVKSVEDIDYMYHGHFFAGILHELPCKLRHPWKPGAHSLLEPPNSLKGFSFQNVWPG